MKYTSSVSSRQIHFNRNLFELSDGFQKELSEKLQALLSLLISSTTYREIFFSHETLAVKLRCSVRTVQRGLNVLRSRGFITWTYRYYQTNLYTVHPDFDNDCQREKARNFLKQFFAFSLVLLLSFTLPKERAAENVRLEDLKELLNIKNHSTKIVGGENYDLLGIEYPHLRYPVSTEFLRIRPKKKEGPVMSYHKQERDVNLSGRLPVWKPNFIPLEPEQQLAVRDQYSKATFTNSFAKHFQKILSDGWKRQQDQAQVDILK